MENKKENVFAEENMVKVRVPLNRNGGDNSDIFVSVNGRNFLIKRGEDVLIPENVAKVLKESEAAQDAAFVFARENEFEPPVL